MPLKSIKFVAPSAKYALIAIAGLVAVLSVYQARLDLAASAAYQGLDRRDPESRQLAEWLIQAAPDDPYVRLAAAHYYERTFEPNDLEQAKDEYEHAAALSPNHYGVWLQLGAALDRTGDVAGAETAYAHASVLAPNYASVAWAYGNSLLRHGKADAGFSLIAAAAAAEPRFADPAVSTALQFFDGDPGEVRRALGSRAAIDAALANVLASQKKWDVAYQSWALIPQEEKQIYSETGLRVMSWAADAQQNRIAASIYGDILGTEGARPIVGSVTNGGFEYGLKLRNAGLFEWQISEGSEPQVGLSESVKRTGRYSMSVVFNSFEASEFRPIWQRVPVEPGASYEFEGYYRADIKSKAGFKWEIVDLKQNVLGATESLGLNGDWSVLKGRFSVPAGIDGIIIRFIRTGCGNTGACPVTGKVFFDDFSLKRS